MISLFTRQALRSIRCQFKVISKAGQLSWQVSYSDSKRFVGFESCTFTRVSCRPASRFRSAKMSGTEDKPRDSYIEEVDEDIEEVSPASGRPVEKGDDDDIAIVSPDEDDIAIVSPDEDDIAIVSPDEDDIAIVSPDEEDIAIVSPDEDEGGPPFTVHEVKIELTEGLKGKLVADLSSICSIDAPQAKTMLEAHSWNMQRAIDSFFDAFASDDENNVSMESVTVLSDDAAPATSSSTSGNKDGAAPKATATVALVSLSDVTSPGADSKKEKETEIEKTDSAGESFSSWAPEKLSVISWNLDGLDDKNLEKRTDAVIEIVLRENYDVVFFQELLPHTFDYISRRICSKYMPIPGTEDSNCTYLTGTFLKLNHVHYEEHYILPYSNTLMERNLLVTKAFIGQAKIALLNTHLESTAEFSSQRIEQLKMCFELAKSFPPEYNVLFGGDLNMRDSEVVGLLPGGMCDLWVKCGSRSTCKYTWDLTRNTNKQMPSKYQPRCRFDRFYFRNSKPSTLDPEFFGVTGIEKVVGTQSFPSDHWAIISFFRLRKEARKPTAKKRKLEADATSS